MKYCLLAAGKGTRNTTYNNLHKALLPIDNKPVIDYIFNNIPLKSEIVVACGYLSEQLKSVLNLYDYQFTFIDVPYDGKLTGPGLSLLLCEEHLQCPFHILTTDTIFKFNLDANYNTAYFTKRPNANRFCNESFQFDNISEHIFSGIATIYDYKRFFDYLKESDHINNQKEYIVALGKLQPKIIYTNTDDTGNNESYQQTLSKYSTKELKDEQCTYIIDNKVIKFFENPILMDKVANKFINYYYSPNVNTLNQNMFYYDYIEGKMLSEINDVRIFNKFFDMIMLECDGELTLTDMQAMYYRKTLDRINKTYVFDNINGYPVLDLSTIIHRIPWETFNTYVPCIFHGDLQPENVIVSNTITFIDPRVSFGSNEKVGDLYYELGKIYQGIIVNEDIIRQNLYSVETNTISWNIKSNLLELKNIMKNKVLQYNLSWNRVVLTGILQYLNIYSLYKNKKYSKFLYMLAVYLLSRFINNDLEELYI